MKAGGSGVIKLRRRIAASPETVFSYFVDPERYRLWQGVDAELDPRPGGLFRVTTTGHSRHVARGSYLEVDPPEVQNRWTVGFRIILAIPAMIVTQILRNLSGALAVFSWFIAVFTARVPEGIRNFAAFALRYETQTYAYIALLTPRYPSFNVGVN